MSTNLQSNFGSDPSTDLLVKIGVCFRLGTMHQIGNAALRKPMMELVKAVNAVFEKNAQEVRVQCVKDCFFVNRQIVPVDNEQAESIQMMRRVLRRLAVHEIAFRDRLSYEEMSDIIAAFQKRIWGMKDSQERIELHSKVELCVLSRSQREKLLRRGDRRAEVIQNYAMLALNIKKISLNFHDLKPVSVTRLRKAIQLTYESFDGYEGLLIGLTRFTNPDGRSYFHAAAVGTLIMLMCRKLGLPRQRTSELTLSGMLYDIARDSLSDPFQGGKINQNTIHQSVRRVERVPLRSLIRLSMGSPNKDDLVRATMAFNASQPKDSLDESTNRLATNLVAVASAYQLISAPIPPRRGLKPDQALALIRNSPDRYNQEISDLLMLTLGPIPMGSLIRLSTNELGVVSRITDQTLFRPRVRILNDQGITTDKIIELSEHPSIEILETLDPVEHNVNVARALIGDLTKEELRDVSDDSVTSIALDEVELDESEPSLDTSGAISTEQEDSVIVEETESQEESLTAELSELSAKTVEEKIEIEPPKPTREITKLEPLITDEINFDAPVDVAISEEKMSEATEGNQAHDNQLDVGLFSNTDVPLSGETTSVAPPEPTVKPDDKPSIAPIRLSTANIQEIIEPLDEQAAVINTENNNSDRVAPIRLNTANLTPLEPLHSIETTEAAVPAVDDLLEDPIEFSEIEGEDDDETVVERNSNPPPPAPLVHLPVDPAQSSEWQALPPLQTPAPLEIDLEIEPVTADSAQQDITIEDVEIEEEGATQTSSETDVIIEDLDIDFNI